MTRVPKELNSDGMKQAILRQVEEGVNDYQIYSALKISYVTFKKWKEDHVQEYANAKEVHMLNALDMVEKNLSKKIFGGWRIKQRFEVDDDGNEKLVSYERQQVDPELNAIMFYLKSKDPQTWNALEVAKMKQDADSGDNMRQLVQDLSKYDVKNYNHDSQEYGVPAEFNDEVQE